MALDEKRPFLPVSIAVLTVSDTRSAADDRSGDTLAERLTKAGHKLAARAIVKDDTAAIVKQLDTWIDAPDVDVVLATGGTGVTGRDVTPEAVLGVCDKEIPGFGELFRWISFQKIGASTIQSRATAGVARGTIEVPADVGQEAAIAAAKADEKIARHLEGKTIRREIYVPGRLVNLVAT